MKYNIILFFLLLVCSTVSSMLSGLETRSLGLNTLGTTQSPGHGFLGLTCSKQGLNFTDSRSQRTATRPGLEPGTPWSVVRDADHCASPPPSASSTIIEFGLVSYKLKNPLMHPHVKR